MKINPERIEELKKVTIQALWAASTTHDQLGISGTEVIRAKSPSHKTEYTEVLRGDLEAEEAVIKVFADAKIPVRFYSEEHGLNLATRPQFMATLDGIDGSFHYQRQFNAGRYATLIAIFANTNPTYDDYLICGYFEHAAKRLMYAVKGQGIFLVDQNSHSSPTLVYTSGQTQLTTDTPTSIDGYFDINLKTFASKLTELSKVSIGTPETGGYSGVAYADIARGKLDLCLECTRKGNLELATGYGLIKEAGGTIILLDGTDLGRKRFLRFGQEPDEHIPTIAAATRELANQAKNYFIQT